MKLVVFAMGMDVGELKVSRAACIFKTGQSGGGPLNPGVPMFAREHVRVCEESCSTALITNGSLCMGKSAANDSSYPWPIISVLDAELMYCQKHVRYPRHPESVYCFTVWIMQIMHGSNIQKKWQS